MNTYWRDDANCSPADDDLFYPDSLVSAHGQYALQAARRICAACPVLQQCRTDILDAEGGAKPGSRFGIVAGMTPEERYSERRAERRQRGGQTTTPKCGTARGYRQHLRDGSPRCAPCLAAQAVAARRARARSAARGQGAASSAAA